MSITEKEVLHVAELARLALTEEEVGLYTVQLKRILGYVEKLSEVDTGGVPPTTCTSLSQGRLREDVVTGSIPQEEALKNAPESRHGCYKVPKIIE